MFTIEDHPNFRNVWFKMVGAFIAVLAILSVRGQAQVVFENHIIYVPYAFVNIVPADGATGAVFDRLVDVVRSKAVIDLEDLQTLAYVREPKDQILRRPPLQYVDGSRAKIKVVEIEGLTPSAGIPHVGIDLGYENVGVSSDVVRGKVAELIKDATDACEASSVHCSITSRIIADSPVGFGGDKP